MTLKRKYTKTVDSCDNCPNFIPEDFSGPDFCRILGSDVYYNQTERANGTYKESVFINLCPLEVIEES